MEKYTINQWLLFFFFYCIAGWIWESCYVSYKEKRWVNRGFLKGPMLPIYGFGAIIVLLVTIPVKDNLVLVFIFGMIAATLLELITGVLMEKIFHVRYWDYANEKLNFKGYICVLCSVAWGFFSILIIKVIHPPVDLIISIIPENVGEVIVILFTIVFTIDAVQSFYAAMDLKHLLLKLTENNETIQMIKNKLDSAATIINNDVKGIEGKIREKVDISLDRNETLRNTNIKTRESFDKLLQNCKDKKIEMMQGISDRIARYNNTLDSLKDKSLPQYSKLKAEFNEYLLKLKKYKNIIELSDNKVYKNSFDMLKRNPKAITKKYAEALKEIKNDIMKD